MALLVFDQYPPLAEPPTTLRTTVWFFSCVDSLVCNEVREPGESSLALIARVGLFSRVDFLMSRQIRRVSESPPTHLTGEWLFP